MPTPRMTGRVKKGVYAACQERQPIRRAPVVVDGPEPPHEWILLGLWAAGVRGSRSTSGVILWAVVSGVGMDEQAP
jgi:hypothetical protein